MGLKGKLFSLRTTILVAHGGLVYYNRGAISRTRDKRIRAGEIGIILENHILIDDFLQLVHKDTYSVLVYFFRQRVRARLFLSRMDKLEHGETKLKGKLVREIEDVS